MIEGAFVIGAFWLFAAGTILMAMVFSRQTTLSARRLDSMIANRERVISDTDHAVQAKDQAPSTRRAAVEHNEVRAY
ncbi:hypothetical protein CCS01_21195 [Rhodopila globiformis]|uniref:Heme exporter protein D n=1 Tax=Rhodopila globiformis TaxID=1071 RepID=A0A2S6N4R3_RHOGL|nr:hypothetical protein CCS01_21195 [Rhodopila globiformis]